VLILAVLHYGVLWSNVSINLLSHLLTMLLNNLTLKNEIEGAVLEGSQKEPRDI
jgi:hypothetical protein